MWGAIISGASALMGAGSGMMAAKRQDRINDMNARLVGQEGQEEERRLQRQIQQTESLMTTMSAASGVKATGSREASIKDIKRENQRQLEWLQKSSRQKASVVLAGGQLQSSQLRTQAAMTGVQGLAQLFQGFSQSSTNSGKG